MDGSTLDFIQAAAKENMVLATTEATTASRLSGRHSTPLILLGDLNVDFNPGNTVINKRQAELTALVASLGLVSEIGCGPSGDKGGK